MGLVAASEDTADHVGDRVEPAGAAVDPAQRVTQQAVQVGQLHAGDLLDDVEEVTGVELPDLDGLLGDPLGGVDGGAGGLDPVTDVVGGVLGGGN